MADNTELNAGGGGDFISTDDVGGFKVQRVKVQYGVDGAATDVSDTNPMPVDDAGGSITVDAASLPLPTGAATSALQLPDGHNVTVDNAAGGAAVNVQDGGNSLTVDGSVTVSGTVTANAGTGFAGVATDAAAHGASQTGIRAMGTDGTNDQQVSVNASGHVNIADGGNVITVDGTVGVSGTVTVDGSGVTQPISAASLPLPTGAATAALQLPDGHNVTVDNAAGASAVNVQDGGNSLTVDGTVTANLAAGTNNIGDVDVLSIAAGDNNIGNVDIVTVPAPLSTTGGGTEATALRVTLANDSTGVVSVDDNGGALTVDGTVTANLAAGTNNIGDVDVLSIAAGDNNIGNVDIVTMPNVTLAAGTNTNEVVGDVAHSAGVAGNPLLVCGVSQDTDDTAPPNRVDAESDATRLATDRDGSLFVRPHGPQVWSYHLNTSSAQTDATVHAAPGANLSLYVTDIVFSSGAATAINLFFEEGASTVLGPYYLEATAGRGMAIHFGTPKKITANTALTLTTSAAIAHSVDVTGFTAQG